LYVDVYNIYMYADVYNIWKNKSTCNKTSNYI